MAKLLLHRKQRRGSSSKHIERSDSYEKNPFPFFPTIDLKATGRNINRLRKELDFSVIDIQNYLGLGSKQAVYRWINGTALPTIDNFFALSVLLRTPIEEIIVQAQFRLEVFDLKQGFPSGESTLFSKLCYHAQNDCFMPITPQLSFRIEQKNRSDANN